MPFACACTESAAMQPVSLLQPTLRQTQPDSVTGALQAHLWLHVCWDQEVGALTLQAVLKQCLCCSVPVTGQHHGLARTPDAEPEDQRAPGACVQVLPACHDQAEQQARSAGSARSAFAARCAARLQVLRLLQRTGPWSTAASWPTRTS